MQSIGDQKRILHLIGGGEIGGAEELVLTLMKFLNKEKYKAHLICLCQGPFAQLAADHGFAAGVIAMRHKLDLSTIKPIREYLVENRIDLVHTHGVRANLVARIAAKKEELPVVTTFHSVLRYDYDSILKAGFARLLTMLTNKNTDQFIAISRAIEKEILQMGVPAKRIKVIYNGLDPSSFTNPGDPREIKRALDLDPDKLTVTMVARLHPVKGHRYFLQAAREIVKTGLNVQFLIIGEGIYKGKIQQWIRELGLDEVVRMPGYYSPIEDIYTVSDILSVPSLMEGLGMVILEAMYFNVPVVASNIGGVPEIIEDQVNGILVQPRDYKSLAQAIMKVLVDGDLADQIRKNGQKTVKEFSLENMAGQVEATYAALLSP